MMDKDIWQRVRERGTLLIEDGTATLVWFGKRAPLLSGDFTDWERGELVGLEQASPRVWVYRLCLSSVAYIAYAYLGGDEKRLLDPSNINSTPNGVGDINHYFHMLEGKPDDLAKRRSKLASWLMYPGRQFMTIL